MAPRVAVALRSHEKRARHLLPATYAVLLMRLQPLPHRHRRPLPTWARRRRTLAVLSSPGGQEELLCQQSQRAKRVGGWSDPTPPTAAASPPCSAVLIAPEVWGVLTRDQAQQTTTVAWPGSQSSWHHRARRDLGLLGCPCWTLGRTACLSCPSPSTQPVLSAVARLEVRSCWWCCRRRCRRRWRCW